MYITFLFSGDFASVQKAIELHCLVCDFCTAISLKYTCSYTTGVLPLKIPFEPRNSGNFSVDCCLHPAIHWESKLRNSMNIQSLLFIFSVEGGEGDSQLPLKECNDIFRGLLFSVSMKIAYCSPFILYICPFCFVILSMGSMAFTLLEFITIEQYITYIHFLHTTGIGRMIKI